MLKRLRLKFVCISMALVTLLLGVLLGLVLHQTRAGLERESLRMMEAALHPPEGGMRPGARPDKGPVRLPFFTLVLEKDGAVRAEGESAVYDLTDGTLVQELAGAALASDRPSGMLPDYALRYLRGEPAGGAQRIVFADVSSERATMAQLWKTCLLLGALGFAAFLGASILLARWAVRPVERAWQQQRQFVADASHELKTPLTVVITNAELLQDARYDAAARARFAGSILEMSRRMRRLVEAMLTLARADCGGPSAELAPVAFSELTVQALLPFEALFFERGLTLESAVEPDLCVRGSAARLRQAVEALLDNAQKYAAAPGTVTVTLTRRRGRCVLSVASSGAPIPPETLAHLFERFYRADPARTGAGGFGLGLSIAEAVVRAHGGRMRAESAGGVNTFFIELDAL